MIKARIYYLVPGLSPKRSKPGQKIHNNGWFTAISFLFVCLFVCVFLFLPFSKNSNRVKVIHNEGPVCAGRSFMVYMREFS